MGMGRIPYFVWCLACGFDEATWPAGRENPDCLLRAAEACPGRAGRFRHPAFPMCGSCPIGISASCLNVGGRRVERKECGAVFAAGVAARHVFTCQTERGFAAQGGEAGTVGSAG